MMHSRVDMARCSYSVIIMHDLNAYELSIQDMISFVVYLISSRNALVLTINENNFRISYSVTS